ncbi:ARID DNA-binding domain-containing protein [Tanacetum coccineum]
MEVIASALDSCFQKLGIKSLFLEWDSSTNGKKTVSVCLEAESMLIGCLQKSTAVLGQSTKVDGSILGRRSQPIINGTITRCGTLSNGTAEVVPRSCCNRRLSHETRAMLKAKIKENEAYNTSGVCATLKQTRKDKRARCFACKERGHVVWNCPHKRNKMKGSIEIHSRGPQEPKVPRSVRGLGFHGK